ncbi:MAG: hypothetical protein ACYTE6_01380 [Planctomycetota bacterium]|jgi:hypothetical protein
MRKPGTDENDVQMSDVLCDFCHREWTDDVPMVEGHRGSCLCARCLTVAYTEVVLNDRGAAPAAYTCPMCLEDEGDRRALGRADEPGWQSPLHEEAVICRRCLELAARSLEKDRDCGWKKPDNSHKSDVTA